MPWKGMEGYSYKRPVSNESYIFFRMNLILTCPTTMRAIFFGNQEDVLQAIEVLGF